MTGVPPAGADWDAILADTPALDLSGLDVPDIITQLGTLPQEERDDLVARLDAEKAKVAKRGDLLDTSFDIFKAVLGAVV